MVHENKCEDTGLGSDKRTVAPMLRREMTLLTLNYLVTSHLCFSF